MDTTIFEGELSDSSWDEFFLESLQGPYHCGDIEPHEPHDDEFTPDGRYFVHTCSGSGPIHYHFDTADLPWPGTYEDGTGDCHNGLPIERECGS